MDRELRERGARLLATMEARDRERGTLRQQQDREIYDAERWHGYNRDEVAMLQRLQRIESEHIAYAEMGDA